MISTINEYLNNQQNSLSVLDTSISVDAYCQIDLSFSNTKLKDFDITDPDKCQTVIEEELRINKAQVAYGGYLEKRNLYADKPNFSGQNYSRNIHLGMDFWTEAGTKVIAPLNGKIHSFQNNATIGDYGPTIILQHEFNGATFHTLYGHLSRESLANINVGQAFDAGTVLATLGTPDINVNYAPHLHFQIIIDMEGKFGDYPGVCSEKNLEFYIKNCPNPNLLLKI